MGKNSDREHVGLTRACFLCSLKWLERAAHCERADRVVRHQRDGSDSLFHFHAASDIIYTDGSDDSLMCGIAEPLTAQWTDKCRYKAVALVCIALCSCPRWQNNVGVQLWPPPPPPPLPPKILLFYGYHLVSSPENETLPTISNSRAF